MCLNMNEDYRQGCRWCWYLARNSTLQFHTYVEMSLVVNDNLGNCECIMSDSATKMFVFNRGTISKIYALSSMALCGNGFPRPHGYPPRNLHSDLAMLPHPKNTNLSTEEMTGYHNLEPKFEHLST